MEKTERECVAQSIELAKKAGYQDRRTDQEPGQTSLKATASISHMDGKNDRIIPDRRRCD